MCFSLTCIWLGIFTPSQQPITWWRQPLMLACSMKQRSLTRWEKNVWILPTMGLCCVLLHMSQSSSPSVLITMLFINAWYLYLYWKASYVTTILHSDLNFDCTLIWRSLPGPVQQTRPLSQRDQKILTHPNFQVEGNCKHASTWVNIVLASIRLSSTRGPRWAEKLQSSGSNGS